MTINKKLLDGNAKFRKEYYEKSGLMVDLAENGQHPEFAIFACTDSRNDPAHIFQLEPGDAFAFRTMGTLVPAYDANDSLSKMLDAHLGFYIEAKDVPEIPVMGHTRCGAAVAIADKIDHPSITPWLRPAGQQALELTENELGELNNDNRSAFLAKLEKNMLIVTYNNLITFPSVKATIGSKLKITIILNELDTGDLYELNTETGEFFLTNAPSNLKLIEPCCDISRKQA